MLSEGAGVDAREHHLFAARSRYLAGHAEGLVDGGRVGAAAREGNGAIGAEIVAAVLYLEEGAGAVARRVLKWEGEWRVGSGEWGVGRWDNGVVVDKIGQEVFAVVAEHKGDAWDFPYLFCRHLGKASDDDNLCVGVLAVGLTDGVAALLFGHSGDGAGVDDVDVGMLAEVDDGMPLRRQRAQDVGGFGKVKLAAQRMCGDNQCILSRGESSLYCTLRTIFRPSSSGKMVKSGCGSSSRISRPSASLETPCTHESDTSTRLLRLA